MNKTFPQLKKVEFHRVWEMAQCFPTLTMPTQDTCSFPRDHIQNIQPAIASVSANLMPLAGL